MTAPSEGHLSGQTGHTEGWPRYLLLSGLGLLFVGLCFLGWAIVDGWAGEFGDNSAFVPLVIGSIAIVLGLGLAVGGAIWARREAGE